MDEGTGGSDQDHPQEKERQNGFLEHTPLHSPLTVFISFFFFVWPLQAAHGLLVPLPGIEPMPLH